MLMEEEDMAEELQSEHVDVAIRARDVETARAARVSHVRNT
jgi:hypothetical protein